MTEQKSYESEILAAIHETASDLYGVDLVDESTMKEFDEMCLTPIKSFSPEEIKTIRVQEHLSQDVFAKYLNVSPNLISKWESGETKPKGSSLKLLSLVQKKGISVLI
jgi:putative transcriptional regulator